nr:MAG: hypothetical protein [Microvirus Sku18]
MELFLTQKIQGSDRVVTSGTVEDLKKWYQSHKWYFKKPLSQRSWKLYKIPSKGEPILHSTLSQFIKKHKL